MSFILAERGHPQRAILERTIQAVFQTEYGAELSVFPNRVAALLDADGAPLAATGLRFAEDGLFSEIYLDRPAEAAVSAAFQRPTTRAQIVEFSSLAAPRSGAALPLVAAAIGYCLDAGAAYGLFTATARLRALLRRAGLVGADLGPADPNRLANASAWGTYYLHDPRVIAVAADSLASLCPLPHIEVRHAQHS